MTSDEEADFIASGRQMAIEAVLAALLARLTPTERLAVAGRLRGALDAMRKGLAGSPGGNATVGGFEILLHELDLIG